MVPTAIGDRCRFHVSEPGAAVDEEDPGEDVLDPPEDLLLLNESGIIFESVPPSDPSRVPFTSLSTARSLSASYPTSLASYVLPSLIVTFARCASLITWKLVTRWPSLSHTNPLPEPWGMSRMSMLNPEERWTCTVVVMCTTDLEHRSNSSTVLRSSAMRGS